MADAFHTRRALLRAIPAITAASAIGSVAIGHDPLLETILAYRRGMLDYSNAPEDEEDEALTERTYRPALLALRSWGQPATTSAGAIAALELALDDSRDNDFDTMQEGLLRAVIGYLETL